MKTISENRCFGGLQGVYEHDSAATKTPMRFAVFAPPAAKKCPVVWWLSGLTCTEQNFIAKSGAQRVAAKYGVFLIAPDTSPRGAGISGEDDAYDFGAGAGFYLNAEVAPWDKNYRMYSYIAEELPEFLAANFAAADFSRQSIMGHSMGGHGALIIALKNPGRFLSVSAFAPICNPSGCDWGRKALRGYLGEDEKLWRQWDAVALLEDGKTAPPLLIDQGAGDEFLSGGQLRPEALYSLPDFAGRLSDFAHQNAEPCQHF
ncbi:MAG: S-formylglutathione hydrolase [Betaproteobacteria bacterium]|nr:S-formylglutathione hydrolase [Betaproteobacteria bacterium]